VRERERKREKEGERGRKREKEGERGRKREKSHAMRLVENLSTTATRRVKLSKWFRGMGGSGNSLSKTSVTN
jgi:hypothetical protein